MNSEELVEKTKKIYAFAKEIDGYNISIDENPYHRQFKHPHYNYLFIKDEIFASITDAELFTQPLIVATLVHDLGNLINGYEGHELVLVSLMMEIDLENEHVCDINEIILETYGNMHKGLRSIAVKKIRAKVKELMTSIFESFQSANELYKWDLLKVYILSTIPIYLHVFLKEQSEFLDPLFNEMIEQKIRLPSREEYLYLIEKEFNDDHLESPIEYFLHDEKIKKLARRFSTAYEYDHIKLLQEIHLIRISDFSHIFNIKAYSDVENDMATFIYNTSKASVGREEAELMIQSGQKKPWNIYTLKFAINIYLFNLRLQKQRILNLTEEKTYSIETLVQEYWMKSI